MRWVDDRTFIRRDNKNEITHYQGIILDVTKRKMAEENLYLDESRLEALLKLNQMTGSSLQEITDFAHEEAIKLTKSKLGYLAFMSPDEGSLIMYSWSNHAMKECNVKDRKFIYPIETTGLWGEAVRQRKPIITNNYQEANPLKKGYPRGHVELTRHMNDETLDIINDLEKKSIENVIHHSQRLRRIVDSFIYTSMEEAGKIEYNFKPMDISVPLENSLVDTIFMIEEKEIVLEKTIPKSLPLINGDEEKLTDMFTVLIDRAIRFTPNKGKVAIIVDEETNYIHIILKDNGSGIPENIIPHMFQRFYEIDSQTKSTSEGIESGFYICKQIADAHKGSIKIESKVNVGTVVHIWIPIKQMGEEYEI